MLAVPLLVCRSPQSHLRVRLLQHHRRVLRPLRRLQGLRRIVTVRIVTRGGVAGVQAAPGKETQDPQLSLASPLL